MKTILVIEDEQFIRLNIKKILQFKGFQVVDAEDGNVGVKKAKAYLPDLIICDVLMHSLDGHGVLSLLRKSPETAAIPFIFLTAKADRSDIRKGMTLGADDYLTKPFTSQELVEAVESRLAKRTAITQPYLNELKQATENLNRAAYCDLLTGLPNRIWFHHHLQELLNQTDSQKLVAVLCLNVNRFSEINNTLGHLMGDLLLQALAKRLSEYAKEWGVVARLNGDEFSLALSHLEQIQDIAYQAQKLIEVVTNPYELGEQKLYIQISLGISYYPVNGVTSEELMTRASVATRQCRGQLNSTYQFYSCTMDALERERQWLAGQLGVALERSQFELYYQPQVNLITGRIIGVESLLRWHHPERGMIPPDVFIPVAEETGLILAIGDWVLQTACTQAKAWQALTPLPLRMSVNLSAHQLNQQNVAESIIQTVSQADLDPNLLVLEITETSMMQNFEVAVKTLHALKAVGIEISIDDFGTGYSSLNYLKTLPIDSLKIDRSFINQINQNEQDTAIATAIIAMAQGLKLKVIAEGVETEEQLAFLRHHGCHAMQGYLYSPPLPAEAIQQLLVDQQRPQWLMRS